MCSVLCQSVQNLGMEKFEENLTKLSTIDDFSAQDANIGPMSLLYALSMLLLSSSLLLLLLLLAYSGTYFVRLLMQQSAVDTIAQRFALLTLVLHWVAT